MVSENQYAHRLVARPSASAKSIPCAPPSIAPTMPNKAMIAAINRLVFNQLPNIAAFQLACASILEFPNFLDGSGPGMIQQLAQPLARQRWRLAVTGGAQRTDVSPTRTPVAIG